MFFFPPKHNLGVCDCPPLDLGTLRKSIPLAFWFFVYVVTGLGSLRSLTVSRESKMGQARERESKGEGGGEGERVTERKRQRQSRIEQETQTEQERKREREKGKKREGE